MQLLLSCHHVCVSLHAGCEVSVLEGAMHNLQAEMHAKRREAYEQEDRLGSDNPPVFATVQVRHGRVAGRFQKGRKSQGRASASALVLCGWVYAMVSFRGMTQREQQTSVSSQLFLTLLPVPAVL